MLMQGLLSQPFGKLTKNETLLMHYPFEVPGVNVFSNISKKEETNRRHYHPLQELQLSIFEYIEGFYNSKRPHGSLHMLTPNEAEALYREQNT